MPSADNNTVDPTPSAPPNPEHSSEESNRVNEGTQMRYPLLPLSNAPEQMEMNSPPRGPFFNPSIEQAYSGGQWSDGLCDCCADQNTCLLMFFVPLWPILMYQILSRTQPRQEPYPLGLPSAEAVAWV